MSNIVYQDLDVGENGIITLRNVVDIESILKANAEEQKNNSARRLSENASKGGNRKVASIPLEIYEALDLGSDPEKLRKFLNENPQYRTAGGRL